ncbi:MAG: response regulator transcription factor [Magnetococcales bacterium]|nr:response regulator transcription factor [Magnetococcales bacterium]
MAEKSMLRCNTSIHPCPAPQTEVAESVPPVVHIVDDERVICQMVTRLLESVHLTVKAATSAQEFWASFVPKQTGCLLLDVRMPVMGGLELQAKLLQEGVLTPVIILSGHSDVPTAVRAMRQGAFHFLEKPFNSQQLLDLVQEAIRVNATRQLQQARRAAACAQLAVLSEREREILDLLVTGRRTKEIATLLDLSTKTVETHRAHIMLKMNVKSVVALAHLVWLSHCPDCPVPVRAGMY